MDPQDGGNATSHYRSGDPINCTDLDGRFRHNVWHGVKRGWHFVKNTRPWCAPRCPS
jgi:hypothetical protein